MGVNTEAFAWDMLRHISDNALHFVGQRATIGVAQHDPACAGFIGRLDAAERIIAIGLVAIKEMFAIDHRFAA